MVDLKRRGFFAAAAVPVAALPVAAAPVVEMHANDVAMVAASPARGWAWADDGPADLAMRDYKAEFIRQFKTRGSVIREGDVLDMGDRHWVVI